MPIDPRIPLSSKVTSSASAGDILQDIQQVRALRAQAAQRKLDLEAKQREAESEQALRDMVSVGPDGQPVLDFQKAFGHLGADKVVAMQNAAGQLTKTMQDVRVATLSADEKARTYLGGLGAIVRESGDDPLAFNAAVTLARLKGAMPSSEADQALVFSRDPAFRKTVIDHAIAFAGVPKPPDLAEIQTVQGGVAGTLFAPKVAGAFYPSVPKAAGAEAAIGSFEDYVQRDATARGKAVESYTTADIDALRETFRLDQRPSVVVTGGGGAGADTEDAEAIADAIIRGDQPPTLTGLYRFAAPVRAALSRKGYPLATATTDWNATQRHYATLNGAQQTRLRQAVDTASHSLDVIDTLAGQWKGSGFPLLNRVNLAAATHGVYGPQAASVAQQLTAQIADLTSELGNVYMGGNSPTDHALQLAKTNLSADWSEKVLKDMTQLARTNLRIRSNAIRNVGVIGASPDNPYAPAAPTAPAAPGGGPGLSYQDYLNSRKK